MWSAYLLVFTQLALAMTRLEFYFDSPGSMHDAQFVDSDKPNYGTLGRHQPYTHPQPPAPSPQPPAPSPQPQP